MTMLLQPELAHYADNRRFPVPVTPYRRGFEDTLYDRVYANPYAAGTTAYEQYRRGNQDARRAERSRHVVLP
jgi:hypothetical protein